MRARLSSALVTARQNLLMSPGRVPAQLEGAPRAVSKEELWVEVCMALAALAVNGNRSGLTHEPIDGATKSRILGQPGTCDANGFATRE